jgi:hypothetical protein
MYIHMFCKDIIANTNPQDGHKIVHFGFDVLGIAGKHLDQRFLDDPQRPPDELFRWHFRQAVLINMRGAGEPVFEHDFPPGSDIMGEILAGTKAAKRSLGKREIRAVRSGWVWRSCNPAQGMHLLTWLVFLSEDSY